MQINYIHKGGFSPNHFKLQVMDLSILGSMGTPSSSVSRKGKKSKAVKQDDTTLSERIMERMLKKPNLKHIGTRKTGTGIKYQGRKLRSDQELQKAKDAVEARVKEHNTDQYLHYVTDLQNIPGGYTYMGGFLVKFTSDECKIIIPKGCTGEHLQNWRIAYEERLITMRNTAKEESCIS